MKQLFIIIGILCLSNNVLEAQTNYPITFTQLPELSAFAGNDTLVCPLYPVTLGGEPTAVGGNGSYYYTWSPPTFMDNPTIANPIITPEESTTYMLSVTDGNGCSVIRFVNVTVDPCLGIDDQPLSESLTIYPNPATDRITIAGINFSIVTTVKYRIINSIGQIIKQEDLNYSNHLNQINVDLDGIPLGIYYIKIMADDELIVRSIQIL